MPFLMLFIPEYSDECLVLEQSLSVLPYLQQKRTKPISFNRNMSCLSTVLKTSRNWEVPRNWRIKLQTERKGLVGMSEAAWSTGLNWANTESSAVADLISGSFSTSLFLFIYKLSFLWFLHFLWFSVLNLLIKEGPFFLLLLLVLLCCFRKFPNRLNLWAELSVKFPFIYSFIFWLKNAF